MSRLQNHVLSHIMTKINLVTPVWYGNFWSRQQIFGLNRDLQMCRRMLFFRGFQVQKVNIKINRMELKNVRLVCSVYSFTETTWTIFLFHWVNRGRSIFYPNPPKDGQFLHKGGRIIKSKEPPKNEPLWNFCKGAAEKWTLRISFFKGCRQKSEGWESCHLWGGGGHG